MQTLHIAKRGLLFSFLFASLHASAADVSVQVSGIAKPQGKVHIALYAGADKFLKDPLMRLVLDAKTPEVVGVLVAVPEGDYAVAAYQDLNGNGVLDVNFIGIPKEPNGVSNNAIGKFGPPKFEDAKFKVAKEPVNARIALHE